MNEVASILYGSNFSTVIILTPQPLIKGSEVLSSPERAGGRADKAC